MQGGNVVRSYRVALGLSPVGQKERSGDFRTPEGSYRLERRNPRSDYFLSIKVSYPNQKDLQRARARHWDSGGSIMIHGLPNQMKHDPDRSEEHTSELQSPCNLVCRLLLEKKKDTNTRQLSLVQLSTGNSSSYRLRSRSCTTSDPVLRFITVGL